MPLLLTNINANIVSQPVGPVKVSSHVVNHSFATTSGVYHALMTVPANGYGIIHYISHVGGVLPSPFYVGFTNSSSSMMQFSVAAGQVITPTSTSISFPIYVPGGTTVYLHQNAGPCSFSFYGTVFINS